MRDAPRLGLVAAPLPLVAAYVQPLTGVRVFLILIEAEAILKNGIALTDVKTFVGSDSGAKFVQTLAVRSLFVPLGASCFVPWGWYCIPLYYKPSPLDEKPPPLRWMHLLHVPYVAAESLPADCAVWTAMADFDTDFLTTKAPRGRMWEERKESFAEMLKEAKVIQARKAG